MDYHLEPGLRMRLRDEFVDVVRENEDIKHIVMLPYITVDEIRHNDTHAAGFSFLETKFPEKNIFLNASAFDIETTPTKTFVTMEDEERQDIVREIVGSLYLDPLLLPKILKLIKYTPKKS